MVPILAFVLPIACTTSKLRSQKFNSKQNLSLSVEMVCKTSKFNIPIENKGQFTQISFRTNALSFDAKTKNY